MDLSPCMVSVAVGLHEWSGLVSRSIFCFLKWLQVQYLSDIPCPVKPAFHNPLLIERGSLNQKLWLEWVLEKRMYLADWYNRAWTCCLLNLERFGQVISNIFKKRFSPQLILLPCFSWHVANSVVVNWRGANSVIWMCPTACSKGKASIYMIPLNLKLICPVA